MDFHLKDVMKWTTFLGLGLPMLIGSLFLSTPAAVIAYWLTLPIFRRRAERRGT
jgi:uncharacterized protein (DUF2062 family)